MNKDTKIVIAITLIGLSFLVWWHYTQEVNLGSPVVVQSMFPDKTLTPGKANTLNTSDLTKTYNGQTYSQSHRDVTDAVKKKVYKEYGISYPQQSGLYEVDHFYPLCAGGSNDINNLWLEPANVMFNGINVGFHTKDKLESYICDQIKKGKIDPKVAYSEITQNWYNYYISLGLDKKLGNISDETVE